jgi:outer membrane lipoprotein-sorting protein
MKRLIYLLGLIVFFSTSLYAQKGKNTTQINDPKARDVLNGVSKKYKSLNAIKVDFVYTLENTSAKVNESYQGVLYTKPNANKFKIELASQEIMSDGKTQWTFLKEVKEVQISMLDESEEAINPAKIFTLYEKGYSYVFTGEQTINGVICQVIELTPVNKNQNIFKARLLINKNAKQLVEIKLFAKDGNRYKYEIKNFKGNPQIDDTYFTC